MSWFSKSEEQVLVDNLLDKIEDRIMNDTASWKISEDIGYHVYKDIFFFKGGKIGWDKSKTTMLSLTKKQEKRLVALETKLNAYKIMDRMNK